MKTNKFKVKRGSSEEVTDANGKIEVSLGVKYEYLLKDYKEKQAVVDGKTPKDIALKKIFTESLYTYSTKYTSIIKLLKENPTELNSEMTL